MTNFLTFALLGLGVGGMFALIGQAIVIVHRGSEVLNFATGAVGMIGAYIYFRLHFGHHWPWAASILIAMAICAVLGAAMHLVVMRRLGNASAATRIVATLGLLTALMATANLYFAPHGLTQAVPSLLPSRRVTLFGGPSVQLNQILLAVIGLVTTVIFVVLQKRTRWGLAVSAVAENRLIAASMGWSPDVVAAATWAMGSGVAAVAMILIAPISGMSVQSMTLLVIPAMAAALVGRFESFGLTLLGALLLGIGESEISWYVKSPGWSDAVPLLIIVAVLGVQGRFLPTRAAVSQRRASVGSGKVGGSALAWFLGGLLLASFVSTTWLGALTTTLIFAIAVLSIVVLTGYVGQLSLCQMAFAGLGAFFTAVLAIQTGFPVWLAILVAIGVTVCVSVVVAVPVIRTRGSNLAIVTLALATVIDELVTNNTWATHVVETHTLRDLRMFGIDFNGLLYPRSYAILITIVFSAVCLIVANLRRSPTGRRLLAVRGNERAAAAMGISVPGAKLFAFAVAAGLAATAGALAEAQFSTPDFSLFSVLGSINTALYGVVGGVGWIAGGPVGSLAAPSGLGARAISDFFNPSGWLDLITGLSVILVLCQSPDGIVPLNVQQAKAVWRRLRGASAPIRRDADNRPEFHTEVQKKQVSPPTNRVLEVRGLCVKFGTQLALDDVSLTVATGEVLGLIGPNGAGKSTLIDVVSGFQRGDAGSVLLDGQPVDKLSASARAQLGISRSFQSLELFEDMSVLDNLRCSSGTQAWRSYVRDLLLPRRSTIPPGIAAAVEHFSLSDTLDMRPSELNYATRRLIAIARALAIDPSFVLLDEPAAGLDEGERDEFVRLIRHLKEEVGLGVLLVEHDVDLVFAVCDRVVALDAGSVIASGSAASVRSNEAVIASYIGSADAPDPTPSVSAEAVSTIRDEP